MVQFRLPAVTSPSAAVLAANARNEILSENARRNAALGALSQIGGFTTDAVGLTANIIDQQQRRGLAERGLGLRERELQQAVIRDNLRRQEGLARDRFASQRFAAEQEQSRIANELARKRLGITEAGIEQDARDADFRRRIGESAEARLAQQLQLERDREERLVGAQQFSEDQFQQRLDQAELDRANELLIERTRQGLLGATGDPVTGQLSENLTDIIATEAAKLDSFNDPRGTLMKFARSEADVARISLMTPQEATAELRAMASGAATSNAQLGVPSTVDTVPPAAPTAPTPAGPPAIQEARRIGRNIKGAAGRALEATGVEGLIDSIGNRLNTIERTLQRGPVGKLGRLRLRKKPLDKRVAERKEEEKKKRRVSSGGLPIPPRR